MKRFEAGQMYNMYGNGFSPVVIVSRSKSGNSVMVNNGYEKFRRKVRINTYNNSEYIVIDNMYPEGSWMRDDVSVYANDPVKDEERRGWEELEPGYKS